RPDSGPRAAAVPDPPRPPGPPAPPRRHRRRPVPAGAEPDPGQPGRARRPPRPGDLVRADRPPRPGAPAGTVTRNADPSGGASARALTLATAQEEPGKATAATALAGRDHGLAARGYVLRILLVRRDLPVHLVGADGEGHPGPVPRAAGLSRRVGGGRR